MTAQRSYCPPYPGDGLPYVERIDAQRGLPSLAVILDGCQVADGPQFALACFLCDAGALPDVAYGAPLQRIVVSIRSNGGMRLCADDLRETYLRGFVLRAFQSALESRREDLRALAEECAS